MWLLHLYRVQLKNAMNLRLAFFLELVGMLLNNVSWVVMFYFLLEAFGGVGGWDGVDAIGLMGLNTLAFGVAYTFGAGLAGPLATRIQEGNLDAFLLRPRSILLQLFGSDFWPATLGDVSFGLSTIVLYGFLTDYSLVTLCLWTLLALPMTFLYWGMSLISSSYSFWRPDDRSVGDAIYRAFINPSMYPLGAFSSPMKIIFTLVLPSLLAGGWQIEWLLRGEWWWYPLFFAAGFAWFFLGAGVFYLGLRRYEGGGGLRR